MLLESWRIRALSFSFLGSNERLSRLSRIEKGRGGEEGTSGERILKRCSRTRARGAAFTELSRSGGKHRAESFNTRVAVSRRAFSQKSADL